MNLDKILYIIRGLPGASKSTLASTLTENVAEADMYFMTSVGYEWKSDEVHKAHKWCQARVARFMKEGREKIAVANTFTTEKELKPYYELANKYNYTAFCVVVENRHGGVNIHDVPEETIDNMRNRLTQNIKL